MALLLRPDVVQTLAADAASQVCVQLSRGWLVLRTVARALAGWLGGRLVQLTSILGRRRAKRLSTDVAAADMVAGERGLVALLTFLEEHIENNRLRRGAWW